MKIIHWNISNESHAMYALRKSGRKAPGQNCFVEVIDADFEPAYRN